MSDMYGHFTSYSFCRVLFAYRVCLSMHFSFSCLLIIDAKLHEGSCVYKLLSSIFLNGMLGTFLNVDFGTMVGVWGMHYIFCGWQPKNCMASVSAFLRTHALADAHDGAVYEYFTS